MNEAAHSRSGSVFFKEHPRGLFYLAFTEAWERFSYYGMTSLVVLYMVEELLHPSHVGNVAGLQGLRDLLEGVSGPLSRQAFASYIFGLYAGLVYFTPILGGIIADKWLGQRSAVVLGALLMCGGHTALAFEQSFLLALLLLILGSGLLKGNITTQVGSLYPRDDAARRTRGFAIFTMGINIGAIAGPIACGWLAQVYGWHVGFGAAAILMLVALTTYLLGYRHLPQSASREVATSALSGQDWRAVAAIALVLLITVLHVIAYHQTANVGLIWVRSHVDLSIGGLDVPPSWFLSLDPLVSTLSVPLVFWLWRRHARGSGEPGDLSKIAIGGFLVAASNLVLVVASLQADKVGLLWPALYYGGQGFAFLFYWPTLLALVSRAAPPQISATVVSMAFLTIFVASNGIGWLGSYYEQLGPTAFWALHSAIGATGGLLILLARPMLRRALRRHISEGEAVGVAA